MAVAGASPAARADEVYTFVVKKQEEKKKTRWTLAEWLDTRDRMRLMDLWLALHSPSPFEFYFGGDFRIAEDAPNNWRMNAAAYASIFGIELQRGFSPRPEWLGLFHLRIFGFHQQATNITLEGGVRAPMTGSRTRNALAGVGMSVYLARYFGLDGLFRHHFGDAAGNHYEGGAFIDFSFIRVYGSYYSDDSSGTNTSGAVAGTRIYF